MTKRKVALASDHAGYRIKESIKKFLTSLGHEVKDFGCFSEESVDYPDFAHQVAVAVDSGKFEMAFTVCGSGNGINMAANKHAGIRSALCWNEEISKFARLHNNANICALPGRFVSESEAKLIVKTFLETGFEGGRHQRRIDRIPLKRI